jgi:hypothetical protein
MATLFSISIQVIERIEMVSKKTPSFSDLVATAKEEEVKEVPADKDHVHTWEENPEHNLAKVHPDVIPALPPSEHAGVTSTVSETVYADEAEVDDKNRKVSDEESEDLQ